MERRQLGRLVNQQSNVRESNEYTAVSLAGGLAPQAPKSLALYTMCPVAQARIVDTRSLRLRRRFLRSLLRCQDGRTRGIHEL